MLSVLVALWFSPQHNYCITTGHPGSPNSSQYHQLRKVLQ